MVLLRLVLPDGSGKWTVEAYAAGASWLYNALPFVLQRRDLSQRDADYTAKWSSIPAAFLGTDRQSARSRRFSHFSAWREIHDSSAVSRRMK